MYVRVCVYVWCMCVYVRMYATDSMVHTMTFVVPVVEPSWNEKQSVGHHEGLIQRSSAS